MDWAEENGGVVGTSRQNLLANRLVLITPKGGKAVSLDTLAGDLTDQRLAMGDPDHVPAGIYGREALKTLGLWEKVKNKLARMANVRSALALVDRGEAAAGIVYATDAPVAGKTDVTSVFPATSHSPIVYPIALTPDGAKKTEAMKFLAFLTGARARALFSRYGFSQPETN